MFNNNHCFVLGYSHIHSDEFLPFETGSHTGTETGYVQDSE